MPVDADNPLMMDDGASRIVVPWPDGSARVTRGEPSGVIVSAGRAGRETRLAHQRNRRMYTITLRAAVGDEAAALIELWHKTQGGADWTRWRHPVDDAAGPAATAPRWAVKSEGLEIGRGRGGVMASGTIELEEI